MLRALRMPLASLLLVGLTAPLAACDERPASLVSLCDGGAQPLDLRELQWPDPVTTGMLEACDGDHPMISALKTHADLMTREALADVLRTRYLDAANYVDVPPMAQGTLGANLLDYFVLACGLDAACFAEILSSPRLAGHPIARHPVFCDFDPSGAAPDAAMQEVADALAGLGMPVCTGTPAKPGIFDQRYGAFYTPRYGLSP